MILIMPCICSSETNAVCFNSLRDVSSVATVDYDYSKAYGGGGVTPTSSTAGRTVGSNVQGASTLDTAKTFPTSGSVIFREQR